MLDEELHNVNVAFCSCPLQCEIVVSVQVCARTKKQLHCLHMPALDREPEGLVHYAPTFAVNSLQQQDLSDYSHVAKATRTLQATAVLNLLELLGGWLITPPGALPPELLPGDPIALVHTRQARQLRRGQMSQHQDMCLWRESCHDALQQQRQLVGR